MGWPALGILVALMFYFKASIQDPVANKRAVFKTFIGILGAILLFMAIANYKMNLSSDSSGTLGDRVPSTGRLHCCPAGDSERVGLRVEVTEPAECAQGARWFRPERRHRPHQFTISEAPYPS